MKRCDWCGQFVSATTEPLTYPNIYGELVTRILCRADNPQAYRLGQLNLTRLQVRS